ncbi:MAG: hypothetical protein H0U13_04160 [Gemmatimonadaceae bacterium]|nr:hypothetical protein [Gemmatimonadaceae bacterium]
MTRERDRAQRAAAQAQRQLERSDMAAAKAAKQEFERLHLAAREAEVEALNSQLAQRLSEIDNVLLATLSVDDYVDLEGLRKRASHPPLVSAHANPIPPSAPMIAPPEPTFIPPDQPKGLGAFLGGRKKYEEALTASRQAFQAEHDAWSSYVRELPMRQLEQLEAHAAAEAERLHRFEADQAAYRQECEAREQQIQSENAALDALIQGLALGHQEAVEEYLGIVLGNSVYPGRTRGRVRLHVRCRHPRTGYLAVASTSG